MLLAAHPSRHRVLSTASTRRSSTSPTPDRRDPALDLYAAGNPNRRTTAGLPRALRERPAIARVRRITASVKERLDGTRAAGRPHDERAFVVHGTLADPRCARPGDRPQRTRAGGQRSWATRASSTKARSGSRASAACAAGCRSGASTTPTPTACGRPPMWPCRRSSSATAPTTSARRATRASCSRRSATRTGVRARSPDANHYYLGHDQIPKVQESAARCVQWLNERGLS